MGTAPKKGQAKSAQMNREAKKRAENTPGEGFNTAMKKVAAKKTAKKAAPKKKGT
jgi:hypothetical protein